MEHFLQHNGYVTVFLTIAFSGELGLFVGVALVHNGAVSLWGVIAIGTAASFVSNLLYYYAGIVLWDKVSFLRRNLGTKVEDTSKIVQRFGPPLMIIARFFYGIRNVIPITIGVYRVNIIVFTVYNLIGSLVWACFFTEAGYLFSIPIIKKLAGLLT
jgi:membrane-associated protein